MPNPILDKVWLHRRAFGLTAAGVAATAAALVIASRTDLLARLSRLPRLTFGLAGQSNMSGRAPLAGLSAFEFPNRDRVAVYSNAGKWVAAAEPVDDPAGQIDTVSKDGAKVGPGLAFGDRLAFLMPEYRIGLVPCAKGSTSMDKWARDLSRASLYGSMVARLKEAGDVAGILFYQGESDTDTEANATAWAGKMARWIEDVRSDLQKPDLPVIVTVLGPDPGKTASWRTLVAEQTAMVLPARVGRVSANDLMGIVGNEIHLDTASQVALGRRYADEMFRLLQAGAARS